MGLLTVLSIAGTCWVGSLVAVWLLCRAAKLADEDADRRLMPGSDRRMSLSGTDSGALRVTTMRAGTVDWR